MDEFNFLFVKLKFARDCSGSLQIGLQNSRTKKTDLPVVNVSGVRTLNPSFWPGVSE
jgi:hypothetical protein